MYITFFQDCEQVWWKFLHIHGSDTPFLLSKKLSSIVWKIKNLWPVKLGKVEKFTHFSEFHLINYRSWRKIVWLQLLEDSYKLLMFYFRNFLNTSDCSMCNPHTNRSSSYKLPRLTTTSWLMVDVGWQSLLGWWWISVDAALNRAQASKIVGLILIAHFVCEVLFPL